MKLIRILGLATCLAAMATAQSTGSSGQQPAGKSPSPTPAASPAKAGAASAKPSAVTTKTQATASAAKPQATGSITPGTAKKATPSPTPAKAAKNQAVSTKKQSPAAATGAKSSPGGPAGSSSAKAKTASTGKTGAAAGKTPVTTTASTGKTGAAAGKTPVTTGTVVPARKTGVGTGTKQAAVKSVAKPVKKAPVAAAVKAKPPVTAAKGTGAAAKPPSATVAEAAPAPEKKTPPRPAGANGRRDPFVSVIRTSSGASGPGANCSQGKRCLSIPELVLQGTVRDISGKMMAVVVNSSRRAYTLRENDQVFNGSVEKITTDSIIFREYVKDALGRETAREVVKKLGPTS